MNAVLKDLRSRLHNGSRAPEWANLVLRELSQYAALAEPPAIGAVLPTTNVTHVSSVTEAAAMADVSREYVRRLVRTGRVRGYRVGKTWVVDLDSLRGVMGHRGLVVVDESRAS